MQVAPADWWQAARSRGAYSLVGCTVAPGFEYADFAFLRDDPDRVALLAALGPEYVALA
jgi:predicted cupin superfamily sugar epimerase